MSVCVCVLFCFLFTRDPDSSKGVGLISAPSAPLSCHHFTSPPGEGELQNTGKMSKMHDTSSRLPALLPPPWPHPSSLGLLAEQILASASENREPGGVNFVTCAIERTSRKRVISMGEPDCCLKVAVACRGGQLLLHIVLKELQSASCLHVRYQWRRFEPKTFGACELIPLTCS